MAAKIKELNERRNNIKNWALDDRPREKLVLHGSRTLSDAELLAILIGSGNTKESAVDLCKRVLSSVHHNLVDLARLELKDLCAFNGIGEAKALTIMAAMELSRRRPSGFDAVRPVVKSSKDAYLFIKGQLEDLPHEEFWLILLNTANRILSKILISKGGRSLVAVDLKVVFGEALKNKATAMILVHNHPSGSKDPSPADQQLTGKIARGAKLLDLKLLDHLIIADQSYFSFADEGLLEA